MKETLYFHSPPETVNCWYCGHICHPSDHEQIHGVAYYCTHHEPLTVMFRCTQHKIDEPNWFFNTVRVTYKEKGLRLDHNFYAGPRATLEKFIPAQDRKWGSHWKGIEILSSDILVATDIRSIYSYLNLYKVWL